MRNGQTASSATQAPTGLGAAGGSPGGAEQPRPAQNAHIVFRLDQKRYAIAVGKVIELDRMPRFTPVPNTPPFVVGVTNVRGDVLSIVDLRRLLGEEFVPRAEVGRLLTVRSAAGDILTGLLVDSLQGMRDVPAEAVRQATDDGDSDAALLSGAFDDRDGEVRLFDVDRFFEFEPIRKLSGR